MQRVIPTEPYNSDPDAQYLRGASRPGPVFAPASVGIVPLGWLLLGGVIAFLVLLAMAWPAPAGLPKEPALKKAAASAWACPGMHAEWIDEKTVQCMKEGRL